MERVEREPADHGGNIARLRDFAMVYEDFDEARQAEEKLKEIDRRWCAESRRAFDFARAQVDAAVERGDYTALRRYDELPANLRHPDVERAVEEECRRHRDGLAAAFAEQTRWAAEQIAAGRAEDAVARLRAFEGISAGGAGARATASIEAMRREMGIRSADAYEPVGREVLALSARRRYDEAAAAIGRHAAAHGAVDQPLGVRRDSAMVAGLRCVWDAYARAVAAIRPGETLSVQDLAGGMARTGTVVSVRDWVLTLSADTDPGAGALKIDLRLLPSTEVARMASGQMSAKPDAQALVGLAALLCVDDFTPPGEGIAMARQMLEAARRAGEPVEHLKAILDQRARDEADMAAEYMLRAARVLCGAGDAQSCRVRCIGLKAKFASSLVVAENLDEIDRMLLATGGAAMPGPAQGAP
jgi:hypothetical protein